MGKKVVLNLSQLSTEGLISLGNNIAEKMTGNGKFPTPPVTMDALKANVESLTTAYANAKFTRSKVDNAEVRALKEALSARIKQLGAYVELVANGNEEVILSAGMNVNKNRHKHPTPEQVKAILAIFTGVPGSILIRWKRSLYSTMFEVYMTETPDVANSWKLIDTITTRRLMVENLASGTKFYFKVVPINAAGVGPESEIAEAYAA